MPLLFYIIMIPLTKEAGYPAWLIAHSCFFVPLPVNYHIRFITKLWNVPLQSFSTERRNLR